MEREPVAIDTEKYERQREVEIYVLTYEAFIRKWKPSDPREVDRFAADLANLLRIHVGDAVKESQKIIHILVEQQRLMTLLPRPA